MVLEHCQNSTSNCSTTRQQTSGILEFKKIRQTKIYLNRFCPLISMKKGKKISGGKYKKQRKRRIRDLQGQKSAVKLGKIKRKSKRISGGKKKVVLLSADEINVKTKDGKIKKVKIKNVLETPSNKFLARQNIITKGTILETELGRVRVSSRPSQSGILNGIVVD